MDLLKKVLIFVAVVAIFGPIAKCMNSDPASECASDPKCRAGAVEMLRREGHDNAARQLEGR